MPRKNRVKKAKPPKGPNVATHLPTDAQELYTHCEAVWTGVKGDPAHFGTPYPPAAQIEDNLTKLGSALTAAESGDPAAIAALEVAAAKVRADFNMLGKYVQSVLRAGSIQDVPAVLSNVLMYESNIGKRAPKPELAARHATISGSVLLIALAVASALVYHFEYSLDQAAWTEIQSGKSRAVVSGLMPGKLYYFRFRAFTRSGGMGAYSQVVTLIAL